MILRKSFTAKRHFDYVRRLSSLRRVAPIIMVAGIAIAAWGQYILLSERDFALRGALLMTVGGLAFLAALLMGWQSLDARALLDEEEEESTVTSFPWSDRQRAGVAMGILGGLAGFFLIDNNTFTLWGSFFWLIGCLGLILGFWPRLGRVRLRLPKLDRPSAWVPIALAFILGVAAFFRFNDLDALPLEMVGDHAAHVYDIRSISDGNFMVWFERAGGRSGLLFYIGAGLTPFFGFSFLTLKIATAIVGMLTVAATYFMTKELFGNRRVALIAAILISLSFWHVSMSRLGFRSALQPLAMALILLFLFRALKYNRSSDFVFAGLFLGLGLYGYQAARINPLAVAAILIISLLVRLFSQRGEPRLFLINAALLVLTAFVVFAPLGRYALDEPSNYWARVTGQVGEQIDTLEALSRNTRETLLMFNWEGAPPSLHNAPDSAQLDYITGAAFALGLGALALYWLLRRRGLNAFAGLALLVMLYPSIGVLNFPHEVPHAARASGAIPVVFAVAALPFSMGFEFLVRSFGRGGSALALALLGVALGVSGFANHQTYFDEYATFNFFNSPNTTEVATVFRGFEERGGDLDDAYIRRPPLRLDPATLAIEIGDLDWRNQFSDIEEARGHAVNPQAKLYVLTVDDGIGVRRLREIYPQGSLYKFLSSRSKPTRDRGFLVFLVPAEGGAPLTPLPNTLPY